MNTDAGPGVKLEVPTLLPPAAPGRLLGLRAVSRQLQVKKSPRGQMEELLGGAGSLLRKRRQGEEGREAVVCTVFQMQQLRYRQGNAWVFFPQPEVCAPKPSLGQLVASVSLVGDERLCPAQGYLQVQFLSFHCSLIADPSVRLSPDVGAVSDASPAANPFESVWWRLPLQQDAGSRSTPRRSHSLPLSAGASRNWETKNIQLLEGKCTKTFPFLDSHSRLQ